MYVGALDQASARAATKGGPRRHLVPSRLPETHTALKVERSRQTHSVAARVTSARGAAEQTASSRRGCRPRLDGLPCPSHP